MEGKVSRASRKLEASPIQELSQLAQTCGAINLAEGFPDFPAPPHLKAAALSAITADFNQYRHVQGICHLLATQMKGRHGIAVNALSDFVICCGQSEAFAASIFAIVDPGDEVLLFDPAYETYESCILLAGGIPVYVPLSPPDWSFKKDELMKYFTSRTKALVLNSPHNPTGKVFTRDELETISEACKIMECFAITDEVYEYITYDRELHISLASLPGMQERTIITSSLSKTFSVTGWRIGWACAPANIASAIRNIHVKITDSAPAPFQEAALTALQSPPDYYCSLRTEYEARRDYVVQILSVLGFQVRFKPKGSVFIFAELPDHCELSDIEFVKKLIEKAGVAAVPGCGFFHTTPQPQDGEKYQRRYIRFAFCKSGETLSAARQKMEQCVNEDGQLSF
ncbi:Kynurenine--oxoglutarate transaminase [Rhynchospora pubera]|uniref:Kynurenine--oxoglutarate transaminase n=1 Tax=Rhynchospora pubera TaxID=906938 RepID=A0AAV8EV62_9POAL|nr:Kynurenine--oxoglutarate transaminase [Rhynchospora pubera]